MSDFVGVAIAVCIRFALSFAVDHKRVGAASTIDYDALCDLMESTPVVCDFVLQKLNEKGTDVALEGAY